MYAVAGYAVFNCVKGGVIKSVLIAININKTAKIASDLEIALENLGWFFCVGVLGV
ncbi:hypothetical protein [Tenacibaculum finnmarkense]|uniref:hypothetical protein n=1 Tax=Tenacibaculum finnmarkense TaxID=2781243 RepID=UPI001EFB929B|nr:hypothetical protein [Tenacibaculum finnmarkense]MCG8802085.1 hypothetical protein [Tenacibaculum finnmarkense]MCG8824813.1 hypothetical protein [Tenacibaculum finnmarkense]